jgi:V/A-type H+-transporting ATPase subunit D
VAELLDVSPTHGNLLELQDTLRSIRGRHDLLDRKREVLVRELMDRLEKASELEERLLECVRDAHQAMQIARMRMGSEAIGWIALSPTAELEVSLSARSIMGVKVSTAHLEIRPISPPYGMGDTSAALDEARERWLEILRFLSDAAETFTAVWRLAREVRKTRRQVNALELDLIPRYENTVRFIEQRLEEQEREDLVHAKKVQEMQAGGRPGW